MQIPMPSANIRKPSPSRGRAPSARKESKPGQRNGPYRASTLKAGYGKTRLDSHQLRSESTRCGEPLIEILPETDKLIPSLLAQLPAKQSSQGNDEK